MTRLSLGTAAAPAPPRGRGSRSLSSLAEKCGRARGSSSGEKDSPFRWSGSSPPAVPTVRTSVRKTPPAGRTVLSAVRGARASARMVRIDTRATRAGARTARASARVARAYPRAAPASARAAPGSPSTSKPLACAGGAPAVPGKARRRRIEGSPKLIGGVSGSRQSRWRSLRGKSHGANRHFRDGNLLRRGSDGLR